MTRVANLNTSRPFILTNDSGVVEVTRAAARQPEVLATGAVRAELEAEEASAGDRLHHDRAGTVAEEHERRAVVPVEDLREHVAADDERAFRETAREHPVRLGDRVHEARAAGEQVVGAGVGGARARRRGSPTSSGTSCPA